MALTMTLHNMPEGFAVAFSAYTPLGPVMAIAIALHNIPEGIIIAAPIYAATGSRWKAIGLATASVRAFVHSDGVTGSHQSDQASLLKTKPIFVSLVNGVFHSKILSFSDVF